MKTDQFRSIQLRQLKITDRFWARVQQLIVDEVIPFQEKILHDEIPGVEKSHAIENFKIAAGLAEGDFYGFVFQDSDLAKWLEGAAYALAIKPDVELEERVDAIIELLALAQQPDGYLNTYFIVVAPERKWQNLLEAHELYCAGHLIEAAVAYYEVTGKDRFLKVMQRTADHIAARFGEDKERGIPGHQEIEFALMRLYRTTGVEKYKALARFFIDERGQNPQYFVEEFERRDWTVFGQTKPPNNRYNQSHAPVYEQKEAVGHSVRAVYMYTAMAALAAEDNDPKLYEACQMLWDNIVDKKMYITGGIGATAHGEAFSINYNLPNDTAYAETCASIGLVFFARQMLKIKRDGRYADVMERALYNIILSGMRLDGRSFFYVNPLEVNPDISGVLPDHVHVLPQRAGWYACACCPPNLVRMITSLGSYAWDETAEAIFSHLFIGQVADLDKAYIHVESQYPWEGQIVYQVQAKVGGAFTLGIRIPAFVKNLAVSMNGTAVDLEEQLKDGYLLLTRVWGDDDRVEIQFDMPVRKIYAHPRVKENAGCVALMRGPIVYCFEGIDNGDSLQSIRIPETISPQVEMCHDGVLAGHMLLKFQGIRLIGEERLYTEVPPHKEDVSLTAVPYFTWGNRGVNPMRVWMLAA